MLDYEGRPLDMSTPIVTVYVGNLAPAVDEGILAMAFAPFGPIANVQVPIGSFCCSVFSILLPSKLHTAGNHL